jgi:hypothetical protein
MAVNDIADAELITKIIDTMFRETPEGISNLPAYICDFLSGLNNDSALLVSHDIVLLLRANG